MKEITIGIKIDEKNEKTATLIKANGFNSEIEKIAWLIMCIENLKLEQIKKLENLKFEK